MATDKEQVEEFLGIVKSSLDEYVAGIDFDALSAAKQLILDAEKNGGRVHVTGIGKPGHATVTCLKKNGAKIIALTGNPQSWLAQQGDVVLVAGVKQEGDSMNKPPRASILAEVIELQCLSILLQNEFGLTPEKYVTWHPGGALGASIRAGK